MKSLYLYLLLPAMFFVQIKLAQSANSPGEDPKSIFTAKVDFKDWTAGVVGCSKEVSDLQIFGFGLDNNGISITLNGEPALGTYEINKKSKHKATYGSVENKFTVGANDFGRVIITKYDSAKKQISGTFELKLTNNKTGKSVKITQGEFKNLDISVRPPMKEYGVKVKRNSIPWQMVAYVVSANKKNPTSSVSTMDDNYGLNLYFPTNSTPGEYALTKDGSYGAKYFNYKNKDEEELKSKSGKLIILKNDNDVISGRFEVELEDESGNKKVTFTSGEFTLFYSKD